jgi:hypothetical protein
VKELFWINKGRTRFSLEFKVADLWIGAFWKTSLNTYHGTTLDIWFCLVPTLPFHFQYHGAPKEN